jgi:adenine-specific DNA-methyltransferase
VVTSPPYNLGKSYEKKQSLENYIAAQTRIIRECHRVLADTGSICWQVGNFVDKRGVSSIVPLDIALYPTFAALGLRLRNRIVWQFEHGLHCANRFSGRHETILWFTKSDDYLFNLDPVRVPQKYPGKKHFRGPKAGQYSCNPLGKNPGDVWSIPNVKSNHVEKTIHPCQFPVELVERLVLSMTEPGDWVLDPFMGVGSALAAAVMHGRRAAGSELLADYVAIASERVGAAMDGTLPVRPRHRPIYDPIRAGNKLTAAPWAETTTNESRQLQLLEKAARYEKSPT